MDVVFDLMKARGRSMKLTRRFRHIYRVHLKAGQLLRVTVQQEGLDVRLEVFSPANKSLFVVDSQNGANGPEPILLVAEEAGTYQIAVSTGTMSPEKGGYSIESVETRAAKQLDRLQTASFQEYYRATDSLRKHQHQYSDEIVEAFEAAATSLDSSRSPKGLRADAWFDLGKAYAAQSRWQESVKVYARSVELYRTVNNKIREALALNEEARGEQNLLEIDLCIYHYKKAIALARAAGNRSIEAKVLAALGLFYAERAQALEAERYLPRAISLSRSIPDEETESKALNARGQLYVRLGEYDAALTVYKDELARLRLAPSRSAVILTQIGDIFAYRRQPEKSFRYYQQALKLQSSDEDSQNRAATLVGFGFASSMLKDFSNAATSYRRALEIYEPRKDFRNQATVFLNLGWTLGEMKRLEEAADSFRRALLLSHYLKNPILEAGALTGAAWIEQRRGNLVEAQREGEKALDLIESVRNGTEEMAQRLDFFAVKQGVYELLIDILMARYRDEGNDIFLQDAIRVSESSRARVLIDKLGRHEAPNLGDKTPSLSVRDIQERALDSDTALLEYSLGERQSYLWWITRQEIKSFSLPPKAEIEALAKDVYQCLKKSQIRGKRAEAIAKVRKLSKMLLGPVADRLGDKRLLIVASGALLSIPFSAFPDPTDSSGDFGREGPWPMPLMVRHDIISEPSASALVRIRAASLDHRPGKPWIALIADGVFSNSDERVLPRFRGRGSDEEPSGSLQRLRASSSEAESISKELPAEQVRKFLGFEANRSLFLKGSLNDASVIHIATHSWIAPEHPEDAAIVLSLVDAHGHEVEGSLGVKDIGALDLQAQLVVLSSCRSALGPNVPGEGVVGLPQAFFSAGVAGVVTSLWDVDDKRTSQLMIHFYQHLLGGEGQSISGALRAAQVEMWKTKEWNAPWFWAGFVAQGEWSFRPITLNKKPSRVSPQDGDPGSSGAKKRNPSPPPRR